ncbi:hypothetical protein DPMN_187567 [Dreissena polymorpha]|uniref:Uncharacterized protein n=1 Tax=Dreissena polymorpha TaxID=45954 RepID=A0A9D4DQG7_DREPO|nr:hypothetical protein DPMN_187567 [Dreissena polymorpha]
MFIIRKNHRNHISLLGFHEHCSKHLASRVFKSCNFISSDNDDDFDKYEFDDDDIDDAFDGDDDDNDGGDGDGGSEGGGGDDGDDKSKDDYGNDDYDDDYVHGGGGVGVGDAYFTMYKIVKEYKEIGKPIDFIFRFLLPILKAWPSLCSVEKRAKQIGRNHVQW